MFLRNGMSRVALFLYLITPTLSELSAQIDAGSRQKSSAVILSGAINPRVRPEDDLGPVKSTREMAQMTLVFRRTLGQQAMLDHLLEELQDPTSPNYHQWLTATEFGESFGASTDQLNRAADWLRSQGFTVE